MWGKGNPYTSLVEMSTEMSTMEVSLEVPHKTENNLPFDPVVPFWDITDSKPQILAHPNQLLPYSQKLSNGSNLYMHQPV